MAVAERDLMTSHRFFRVASLMFFALSTGLAGCAATDESDDDGEELAAADSEMLSGAGIVPQVSIGGIKFGMTPSKVSGVLGKPDKIERFVGGAPAHYVYGQTVVRFGQSGALEGRVVSAKTWSQGVRTKENVGVGSLRLNVAALPDMKCSSRKTDVDGETVYRHECAITSAAAFTKFDFMPTDKEAFDANAKVISVELWKL